MALGPTDRHSAADSQYTLPPTHGSGMDLHLSLEDNIRSHPRLPANILPGMAEVPVTEELSTKAFSKQTC